MLLWGRELSFVLEEQPMLTKEIQVIQEIGPWLVRIMMEVPKGNALGFMIH